MYLKHRMDTRKISTVGFVQIGTDKTSSTKGWLVGKKIHSAVLMPIKQIHDYYYSQNKARFLWLCDAWMLCVAWWQTPALLSQRGFTNFPSDAEALSINSVHCKAGCPDGMGTRPRYPMSAPPNHGRGGKRTKEPSYLMPGSHNP